MCLTGYYERIGEEDEDGISITSADSEESPSDDSEDEDFDPKDELPKSRLKKPVPASKRKSPAKLNASASKRKTSAAKPKKSSKAKATSADLQKLIGTEISILWTNGETYEGKIIDFRVLGSSASSDVMIKIFYEGMCLFVALCMPWYFNLSFRSLTTPTYLSFVETKCGCDMTHAVPCRGHECV